MSHETHVPHWYCVPAEEGSRESVDAGCRRLTAAWVREAKIKDPSIETCDFFEAHEKAGHEALLPPGEQIAHECMQSTTLSEAVTILNVLL
jgi:hypothetical protein